MPFGNHFIKQFVCAFVLVQMPLLAAQSLQISPAELTIAPAIEDTSGIYIFRIANNSQLPQTITEFKGGCSCVGHELKVSELAPGASSDLTVTLDFEDSVGPLKRNLFGLTEYDESREGGTKRDSDKLMWSEFNKIPQSINGHLRFWQCDMLRRTIKNNSWNIQ